MGNNVAAAAAGLLESGANVVGSNCGNGSETMVAIARILMPRSTLRLSAGRDELSEEAQALCFMAGAGSIFVGEELLTTPNPERASDAALLEKLGMRPLVE